MTYGDTTDLGSLRSSSMFHSAYDEVPLEDDSNSSSSTEQELPFINEERVPLRRNTPPILRVEQSLHESGIENSFMRNSRTFLPDLDLGESRESYYWRWIMFGIPAFYGILISFTSMVRTFAGYHDYMTKFAFWWLFTLAAGVSGFSIYTRWRKQRDSRFLSWWEERPLNNRNEFDDNL